MQRDKYIAKMKAEQERNEVYKKQKEMIMESKHLNQMIDQMKINYYKEMCYNMRIKNKVGCDEFDEMTKNLKSFPEEDVKIVEAPPDKTNYHQRINQLFGFTMKRYKCSNNLKPILGARTLALTADGNQEENKAKHKRAQSRGLSVSNSNWK